MVPCYSLIRGLGNFPRLIHACKQRVAWHQSSRKVLNAANSLIHWLIYYSRENFFLVGKAGKLGRRICRDCLHHHPRSRRHPLSGAGDFARLLGELSQADGNFGLIAGATNGWSMGRLDGAVAVIATPGLLVLGATRSRGT